MSQLNENNSMCINYNKYIVFDHNYVYLINTNSEKNLFVIAFNWWKWKFFGLLNLLDEIYFLKN